MAEPRRHSADCHAATPGPALFQLKAIASEMRAKEATDPAQRQDWEELAIEWRLLAGLAAHDAVPARQEATGLDDYISDLTGAMRRVQHRR